jgi:hypothetical protein
MASPTNSNPHWQRTLQYQQRQGKPDRQQQHRQPQPARQRTRDDFGDEWKDRDVVIEQVKGTNVNIIKGRVYDVSKYWLKVFVDNQILYLNKAYVLSIKPVEVKGGSGVVGNDRSGQQPNN